MPQAPTLLEIASAREYILRRIHNQNLLEEEMEAEFNEAAISIAQIILKYKNRGQRLRFTGSSRMAEEIEDVLRHLREQIDYHVNFYCIPEEATDDKESEEDIIGFIRGEDHGHTFAERENLYLSNYLMAIAGIDFSELYDEDVIEEAIREAASKPEGRMSLLALNTVALGYAFYQMEQAKAGGAIGFFVYPGSTNPCEYCQGKFYVFHSIEEEAPPYHPHCRCITVYVTI